MEFLLLHLLAYFGMWSILWAFERLIRSMQQEQTIQLLELQTQAQETYVREAKAHYEQTRSFRHDIKNHFIVLKELLSRGDLQKASAYLAPLDEAADSLSVPVHCNNAVVDVLLGSKWMAAQQHGIDTQCELKLPAGGAIWDMDWCILLANAVDNAISANQSPEIPRRYLRISGREKGNLFLLHLENSCAPSATTPVYGVGLNNIAAVVEKYHGQMDLESANGRFQLDILLVLSQP